MSKIYELRAERHAISLEMHKALDNPNTVEGKAKYAELDARQEALRLDIEQREKLEKLTNELAAVRHIDPPAVSPENRANMTTEEKRASAEYKKDFEGFVRTGKATPELRALGAASGADGATLVPTGFQREVEVFMKAIGGFSNICRKITTETGNSLPWPTMDDTNNTGEFLAESAAISNADPTFSNVTLGAFLASSKQVLVPVQLLQDAFTDPAAILAEAFGVRLARITNHAYTVGNTDPIVGLITALVAGTGRSVLAVGANSNSGVSGDNDLNTVGTDDLTAIITKVDPAYRIGPNVGFGANQSTWDKLRSLKDKYGRPIWQVSLSEGVPDSILGYKYFYNQDMAGIGAGNISVCFGDFSKYIIRNVLGMTLVRFNELYMTNHQVGFQAFLRTDAKLLQKNAFSYLIHPLS